MRTSVQATLCMMETQISLLRKGRTAAFLQFSAHFYCGQTAGCIKMPLGMEAGLGLGHILLDGDPASQKGRATFNCRPMLIVAKRLHGSRCTWYGGRPWPRRCFVRWRPISPPQKKGAQPANFGSMSIVATRLDGSICHLL